MKCLQYILFLLLFLATNLSFSQLLNFEYDTAFYTNYEDRDILVYARNAKFDTSIEDWDTYLSRKLRYPKSAKRRGITGSVVVQFVVERNGSLSNFKLLNDIGHGCGQEAIQVIKNSPKWIPGSVSPNGENWRNVRQLMKQKVYFK